MRLFVAVEISPAVVARALDVISRLQSTVTRLAPHARITWVTAERLHVTVRFIGHVDEAQGDAVRAALAAPFGERFDLTIAGIGTFPPKGSPRVIWAGFTAGRDQLISLEQLVSDRLAKAGVAPEQRPFNPHLTLARVRDPGGVRSATLLESFRDRVLGTTSVDAITLFESRLSPNGPTYLALDRMALRAGSST